MSGSTTQSVIFTTLLSKPVVAAFDHAHSSEDGGALLLKAIDERLGLSAQLASCLRDRREPGKVRHELEELFRQRLFVIAMGHPDCNDAQVLADDPIHKMLVDRMPISGDRLGSQSTPRRVVLKAEVVDYPGREPRQNLRFVVTNLRTTPKHVYQFYCGRGNAENRIKEFKHGLELGRTSCSSFMANQLRVQLTAAAYVLMQELAQQARHTAYRDAQATRLRDRLLKLPVWVEESVRRIVMHLPTAFLTKAGWQRTALAVGGQSPSIHPRRWNGIGCTARSWTPPSRIERSVQKRLPVGLSRPNQGRTPPKTKTKSIDVSFGSADHA